MQAPPKHVRSPFTGGHLLTQVGLHVQLCYEDIFCCMCKPAVELQQKLNIVTKNVQSLRNFILVFKKKHLNYHSEKVQNAIAKVRRALGKLIVFCSNSDDMNPLTRDGVPIATHQACDNA